MSTITFYRRDDRTTEYFLLPLNQEVIELLIAAYSRGETNTCEVIYGKTRCHPKDKMVKAVGKEEAQKQCKKTKFKISDVLITEKEINIRLGYKDTDIVVLLFKDTGKVHCF